MMEEMNNGTSPSSEDETGREASGQFGEEAARNDARARFISETKEWIKSIVIALVLALVLKSVVVQSYMIPTGSMEPTIMPYDRVFGNRFIYRLHDPAPGDIISFRPPPAAVNSLEYLYAQDSQRGNTKVIPYLKRVIAVAGDTVRVHDGKVYRNNIPLDEPYIMEKPNYEFPTVRVPKDMVFVMGDNRCNSHDSHIWGFLPKRNIQAKAFFRFWPVKRIGVLR
ncbi:MAG TPA: signal peptidase I [bacterium]|nr:signal peptidase I [bacterium]